MILWMIKKLTTNDFKSVPWKNGGGNTCEIYQLTDPANPTNFLLRFSLATISQSGPFSLFPHIDRTIILLNGDGIMMEFSDGHKKQLNIKYSPFNFSGEAAVNAILLNRQCEDFNVMVDRRWGTAQVMVQEIERFAASIPAYIFHFNDMCFYILAPGDTLEFPHQQTVIITTL